MLVAACATVAALVRKLAVDFMTRLSISACVRVRRRGISTGNLLVNASSAVSRYACSYLNAGVLFVQPLGTRRAPRGEALVVKAQRTGIGKI